RGCIGGRRRLASRASDPDSPHRDRGPGLSPGHRSPGGRSARYRTSGEGRVLPRPTNSVTRRGRDPDRRGRGGDSKPGEMSFVGAADEGVMPQTREHLDIIDLLDVRRGLVALTKTDLVDEDWLALVTEEVRATINGTSLDGSKVIPVSAVTGAGLAQLTAALDALLEKSCPREASGRPRLPLDR